MASIPDLTCSVCQKDRKDVEKFYRCSSCVVRIYCGRACQKADWSSHKKSCSPIKWYDRHRKCGDGSFHEGDLDLITWDCPNEMTGWGRVYKGEEEEHIKEMFENEFGGDLQKLFDYHPLAFRWTCCGIDAFESVDRGCEHHGRGREPCRCDLCRIGRSQPIHRAYIHTSARMGLNLSNGPDPRSYDHDAAEMARIGRSIFGDDI